MDLRRINQEQPKSLERKIKKILAQCCAVTGPDFLMLMCGMSSGFLTILLPELYRKDAEIIVTTDELTWISSTKSFASPLGGLVAGVLVDRVGRKPIMLLAAVSYLLSWFLFYFWATNAWTLMLAFALLGITGDTTNAATHAYLPEVIESRYRGIVLTTLPLSITIGTFLQFLIGNYLHWRTCALVNAAIIGIALTGIFFLPESPHWLAEQGRLPETKRSLQWLRGWTDSDNVKLEYNLLIEVSSDTAKQTSSSCKSIGKRFLRRDVLLPLSVLTFTLLISAFNGANTLSIYSVIVFEKIESPISEYDATIANGALQVLALVILILSISRIGKRLPTLGSLFVSALALLAVSVYVYLREQDIIQQDSAHSWIPMTLVLLVIFVCSGGIQTTAWILSSELFPVEVRGISVGTLGAISSVCHALADKSFLYMLDELTLPGAFASYATISLLGFIALYWVIPETEGKSVAEIELIYRSSCKTQVNGKSAMESNTESC